jgi:hypothetical protein
MSTGVATADDVYAYLPSRASNSLMVSSDAGTHWQATAALSGHPTLVEADPTDPRTAYVGFSYPAQLDMTTATAASTGGLS